MPKVRGVLETSIYVADLERARRFYGELIGLRSMHDDARMSAYEAGPGSAFLVFARGASTRTVELPGGTIPGHDGNGPLHFAFAIAAEELPAWEQRLADHAIAIEGRVKWPKGGESIYFSDPDGHLVELATPGLWDNY